MHEGALSLLLLSPDCRWQDRGPVMIIRLMMTSSSSSPSPPLRAPIRLILFDAFDTLVTPRKPPYVQYWEEVEKELNVGERRQIEESVGGGEEMMKRVFKEAFREMTTLYPIYGLHSQSIVTSPNDWWLQLIRRCVEKTTEAAAISLEKGDGQRRQRTDSIMDTVGPRLLQRFSTRAGYELAEGVPTIFTHLNEVRDDKQQQHQSKGREETNQVQGMSYPQGEKEKILTWKLATNSDNRILDVCRDLCLESHINLHHQGQNDDGVDKGPSSLAPPTEPCLSYHLGYEKPDSRFFHQAVQRTYRYLHLHDHNKKHIDELDLPSLYAQTLYVGDHYHEDYVGATRAGLQAVWLQRAQPWPSEVPEEQRKKIVAVQSMEQIIDIIKRSWSR